MMRHLLLFLHSFLFFPCLLVRDSDTLRTIEIPADRSPLRLVSQSLSSYGWGAARVAVPGGPLASPPPGFRPGAGGTAPSPPFGGVGGGGGCLYLWGGRLSAGWPPPQCLLLLVLFLAVAAAVLNRSCQDILFGS